MRGGPAQAAGATLLLRCHRARSAGAEADVDYASTRDCAALIVPVRLPAQSAVINRLVILALRHVLRASVVEAQNRIVRVLFRCGESNSFAQIIARLRIHLRAFIVVVVPVWASYPTLNRTRPGVLILVGCDIGPVVGDGEGDKRSFRGVGRIDIVGKRCLSYQRWRISTAGHVVVSRCRPGHIRVDARTRKNSGEESEVLLVR